MTLHLGAHLISTAPYVAQAHVNNHAYLVAGYFKKVATAQNLRPIEIKNGYYGNAYRNWAATLTTGQVMYGVRAKPDSKGTVDVRLEFNPAKLSSLDFELMEDHIIELLGLQTDFLSILPGARVTRLDIAIDILGILIPDLLFVGRGRSGSVIRGARSTGDSESIWNEENGIETLYFRTGAKSPTLKLRAYNKDQERLHRGEILTLPTVPTTRIEVVITRQNLQMNALPSLPNPFSALGLCDLTHRDISAAVADSVRVRGSAAARLIHPCEAYHKLRVHRQTDAPWWKPRELWKHWPDSLLKNRFGEWVSIAACPPSAGLLNEGYQSGSYQC
ncbi:hypothetical protein [uncultured Hyphomonas sp.]|uniref:hypothetical protein n=1 Tax=uncultured Hyphomonas sp. TaxID=225298 RepID=UPI002AAB1CA2|nr:hypothetical protein [uncultured Hyphomonas sp.]